MEEQEIRLGNYIQYRDKSSLLTVESLGSNGFSTINQDGIQYGSDDISEYNGIPLTEEWLVKFGFRRSTGEFKLLINNKKGMLSVILRPDGIGMIGVAGPWGLYDSIHYKYVHQIQNLYFALTGEDLSLIN